MSYQNIGSAVGALVDKKQNQYGDSFNKADEFLKVLYPDGINPDQYKDLLTLTRIFDKLMRVANGNQGDEDAFKDIAGYALLALGSGSDVSQKDV